MIQGKINRIWQTTKAKS